MAVRIPPEGRTSPRIPWREGELDIEGELGFLDEQGDYDG